MKESINPSKIILPEFYEEQPTVETEILKHVAPFLTRDNAEIEVRLGRIMTNSKKSLWEQFPVKIPTIVSKNERECRFNAGVS